MIRPNLLVGRLQHRNHASFVTLLGVTLSLYFVVANVRFEQDWIARKVPAAVKLFN